ncbi:hypothetical protein AB4156_13995 [Cupriavidus sp. 2MCAB6]|uniref:hypothetical protein n=1 Tax=Cupriavidus sp. 2MCAB6 TaxID=3232981 RepID=UPI003F930C86
MLAPKLRLLRWASVDEEGKARIDIFMCAHRHAAHVGGLADSAWKAVEVKEVRFPWTEDPGDADAGVMREKQSGPMRPQR